MLVAGWSHLTAARRPETHAGAQGEPHVPPLGGRWAPPSARGAARNEVSPRALAPASASPDRWVRSDAPHKIFVVDTQWTCLDAIVRSQLAGERLTVLVGEAGVGKTTIVGAALKRLARCPMRFLPIGERELDTLRQLQATEGREAVRAWYERLSEPGRWDDDGRAETRVCLIIDSAERLSVESLRAFAALLSLSPAPTALLVGRPELLQALRHPDLERWQNGVTTHSVLRPLTDEGSRLYAAHLFEAAGSCLENVMSRRQTAALVRLGRGNPGRLQALVLGSLERGCREGGTLTERAVEEAAAAIELPRQSAIGGATRRELASELPEISIVICTLHRPLQLAGALRSCLALADLDRYRVEILVVDNSPEADGESVVAPHLATQNPTIRYLNEPRLGVAHARNAGIAAARAPIVAFIDDDMRFSPGWLGSVMRCMADSRVAALVCAIEPQPEQPNQVMDARWLTPYRRDLGLPEGAPVRIKRSGHIPGAGAGNSVLRRSICFTNPEPFDPAFGNGGEDTDFFLRLGRSGARILWSADSLAYELVSPARAQMEFVTYIAARGSRNFARALIKNSRYPFLARTRLLAVGGIQGLLRTLLYYGFYLVGSPEASRAKLAAIAALGKLPWSLDRGSWWAMPR